MNPKLILIVSVIAGLSSCSTAYKIAQTPDDVYYSPAPRQSGYVQTNNDENNNVYNNPFPEDREISRHVNSRRWRRLHEYDYDYPNGYGYYPYGNNYPVYVDPKTGTPPPAYTAPRKYDLGTYAKPPLTGNASSITPTTNTGTPVRTFTKPNSGTGVGNFIRKVFSNPNTNVSNNDNTTQSRSFEQTRNNTNTNNSSNSSSGSRSSSSSSSSGNAPVRTFNK